MKITNVDIYASMGDASKTLNLNLSDLENTSPYIIKDIMGLDVDELFPSFYAEGLAQNKYYDLTALPREIVIQIGLNPKYSFGQAYDTLRSELYKFISMFRTGKIELRFKDENIVKVFLSGFIKKIEPKLFTNAPEVHVTIKCDNSMLRAVDETIVDISSFGPGINVVEDNESTAPHGFRFAVTFIYNTFKFFVKDEETPNWKFEIDLSTSPLIEFIEGDQIFFSSELNNRHVNLFRDGQFKPLIDRIVSNSIWPVIFPGENQFIIPSQTEWNYIRHYPTYWGI